MYITGALNVSNGITGSLEGTASYATQALSASYAPQDPLPSGLVSGSSQISYTGITDVPSGIISGSSQISDLGFATTSSVNTKLDTGSFNTYSGDTLNVINQKLDSGSFNSYTSSNDTKVNDLISQTGSYVTETESGSFVTNVSQGPALFDDLLIITKGDGSSYNITVNNVTNADSSSFSQTSVSSSYATNALSASYAPSVSIDTGSFATTGSNTFIGNQLINGDLNVTGALTASGLIYPIVDNGEKSFIQSDGNGNLSLQYVDTLLEPIRNGEATTLVKGTPVYVSGSLGANPIVFAADAGDPTKMPVIYIVNENILTNEVGNGILLGKIDGVDTTGYAPGTEIFVGVGGGWTQTRPTGSAIIQSLGIVTKEGSGGQGIVLNPGPVSLPNIPTNELFIGDVNSYPVPKTINEIGLAITGSNQFSDSQEITGALKIVLYDEPYDSYFTFAEFNAANDPAIQFNTNTKVEGGNLTVGGDIKGNFITDKDGTNPLVISGSQGISISGSLSVENGITGSLLGTSSYATNALTASFALNGGGGSVDTGSFATTGSNTFTGNQTIQSGNSLFASTISVAGLGDDLNLGGAGSSKIILNNNTEITGSVNVTNGITGSLEGTASYATNALTASYALSSPGGAAFPFTGSAVITGSLTVTGSILVSNGTNSGSVITNQTDDQSLPRVNNIVTLTSAEYNTMATASSLDANTLYVVSGSAATSPFPYSGSAVITGSLIVTNGITGSLLGSSSYAINALTASFALNGGGGGSAFPFTGSAIITGSLTITGSVNGSVNALSISSNTASLNLSNGDFFTLQLVSGSNTFINPSNIKIGQTTNILLSTTGSATVSFPTSVKQISGSSYVPTTTTSKDIITLVSFDGSTLYLANVKNLV